MKFTPRSEPFKLPLGQRGEMAAWGYLLKHGYKILEKNYRCKIGEIDVVAQKNGRLIFIEVKTRQSDHFGSPEEAVHKLKQKKIAQTAQWYQKEKGATDHPVSFEVVAVDWRDGAAPVIRLITDAFAIDSFDAN